MSLKFLRFNPFAEWTPHSFFTQGSSYPRTLCAPPNGDLPCSSHSVMLRSAHCSTHVVPYVWLHPSCLNPKFRALCVFNFKESSLSSIYFHAISSWECRVISSLLPFAFPSSLPCVILILMDLYLLWFWLCVVFIPPSAMYLRLAPCWQKPVCCSFFFTMLQLLNALFSLTAFGIVRFWRPKGTRFPEDRPSSDLWQISGAQGFH